MTTDRRIAPWVAQGAPAASAALLLYFVWRSRRRPLIRDAALMYYVAWLTGTGAAPDRDIFDSNMPG